MVLAERGFLMGEMEKGFATIACIVTFSFLLLFKTLGNGTVSYVIANVEF